MLNTAFERQLEHERAVANLKPRDRQEARRIHKFDHFNEHPYTVSPYHGKLMKQPESKHLDAMLVLNQKIDTLTLKYLAAMNENDQILNENYSISREAKSLSMTNSKLSKQLTLEKSINKDSQRRIDSLRSELRKHVG